MTDGSHRGKAGNRIQLDGWASPSRNITVSTIVVTVEMEKNDPHGTWPY